MKEVLGKTNKPGSRLPTKLVIKKKRRDKWNWHSKWVLQVFPNIGPELARKIPTASRKFESFSNKIDITMSADSVT